MFFVSVAFLVYEGTRSKIMIWFTRKSDKILIQFIRKTGSKTIQPEGQRTRKYKTAMERPVGYPDLFLPA